MKYFPLIITVILANLAGAQVHITETPSGDRIIHIEAGIIFVFSGSDFRPLHKFSIGGSHATKAHVNKDGSGIMLLQETTLNYYQLESGKLMASHVLQNIDFSDYTVITEFEFVEQNQFRAIVLSENQVHEITWDISSLQSSPKFVVNPKSYLKREESFNLFFGQLYQKESAVDSAGIPMPPNDFNIIVSMRDLKRKKIIQVQSRSNEYQIVRYSFDANFAVKQVLKKEMDFFHGTGTPQQPVTKLLGSDLFIVGYGDDAAAYVFVINAETLSLKKQIQVDDSYLKYSNYAIVVGEGPRIFGISPGEPSKVTIVDVKTGSVVHTYSVDTKFSK